MPDNLDRIVTLLERLCVGVEALHAQRAHTPVTAHTAMLELLAAVHEAVADRCFSTRDLIVHAELTRAWRLRTAIGVVVGAGSPARTLGHALRRYEGVELGGLSVLRIGADRDGATWQVVSAARVLRD